MKYRYLPTVSLLHRLVGTLVIRLLGWRIDGLPPDQSKLVMIGGPHTANFDVFLLVMMSWSLGVKMSFLVATDLPPLLFRLAIMAGGIPIDRNGANENTVQQVVDYFRKVDKVCLMIAPEGRLRRMDYWRSGFYYIALGAGVPVVPGNMDYKRKLIEVTTPFLPTGDIEADFAPYIPFYEKVTPRFPEKAGPVRVRARTEAMEKRIQNRAMRQNGDDLSA